MSAAVSPSAGKPHRDGSLLLYPYAHLGGLLELENPYPLCFALGSLLRV